MKEDAAPTPPQRAFVQSLREVIEDKADRKFQMFSLDRLRLTSGEEGDVYRFSIQVSNDADGYGDEFIHVRVRRSAEGILFIQQVKQAVTQNTPFE